MPDGVSQAQVLRELNRRNVNAIFHYVPLHSSPAGERYGRTRSSMATTDDRSERLVRLPLWVGMGDDTPARVISEVAATLDALT
jgi:dTDP-4-amino-4,6-dideoxygalactose transaminase